ncbi:unnamed protein product [Pseudo-nitzschia multistriata]|uniref:Uncharacterized protein n=1 Tax=Pseudo-nitzschia multistriata TaxID=183589 RepID=A0A448YV97_9STRA|nr:unnamed protein product [Pseudo-nitzschia multistriata]
MAGYVTKPAAAVNKALVEFLPELDSDYATYPMKHDRWYEPDETGPKGEPCFIAKGGTSLATGSPPIKKDYVYCTTGGNGEGYYSLMCRTSYINLYYKLKSCAPQGTCTACPCFASKATRDALDRYDDCKRVVYMRQKCFPKPDDKLASDIVMGIAKDTANMVYHGTQNEQLIVNAVF